MGLEELGLKPAALERAEARLRSDLAARMNLRAASTPPRVRTRAVAVGSAR